MMRIKGGAVRMALEAGVPILPVTIRGANRVWPARKIGTAARGKWKLFIIRFSTPSSNLREEARACARRETERLAEIIRSAL